MSKYRRQKEHNIVVLKKILLWNTTIKHFYKTDDYESVFFMVSLPDRTAMDDNILPFTRQTP